MFQCHVKLVNGPKAVEIDLALVGVEVPERLQVLPMLCRVIRSICASNFFGKVLGVQEDPNIGAQDLVVRGPIKGLGAVIAEK